MSYTEEDTIFVQIASYRDPELQWTLKDLFEKAKRPKNIFVGICHQYDMEGDEDKHLFEIPFSHPEQLRIDEVDYRESQGCCWARNRVQKLWKGEKWTLMIDSHMRFEEDWDELLVEEFYKYPNCIISQFCGDTLPDKVYTNYVCKPNFNQEHFDNNSIILFGYGAFINKYDNNISAMISARFIFALSNIIQEIKYDKYLYFYGEEINLAVRFWTNDYILYCPNKIIAHHHRINNSNINKKDNKNHVKQDYISYARVKHLLNTKKTKDSEVLQNIKEYGLGNKRTLRDYERFSGVDFRKKITKEHTKQGVFEEWQEVSNIVNIKKIFNNKYGN